MKNYLAAILFTLTCCFGHAAGKIQNEDVKSLSELTGAGGSVSQLINDTKIYVTANGYNTQLSTVLTNDIPTNPMTTLGDFVYGGASGAFTRLPGNTTAVKEFMTSTGTGSAATAPVLSTIAVGDLPAYSSVAKTATYTTVTTDSFIRADTSGGAFTITLIGASLASRPLTICRTDSSTNILTIAAAATEAIQSITTPATTISLHMLGECVTLTSNLANRWYMATEQRTVEAVVTNNGTTCSITQHGTWASSATRNGAGNCQINVKAGIFSDTEYCTCSSAVTSPGTSWVCILNGAPSPSVVNFVTNNSGTNTDGSAQIICVGPK